MISTENRRLRNHPPWVFIRVLYMSCHNLLVLRFVFPPCVTGLMIWPPWETSRSGQPNLICNQCLINFPWSRFRRNTRFQCYIFTFNPELYLLRTPKRLPMGNLIILRVGGRAVNISLTLPLIPLPSPWTTSLRSLQHERGLCGGESPQLTLPSS